MSRSTIEQEHNNQIVDISSGSTPTLPDAVEINGREAPQPQEPDNEDWENASLTRVVYMNESRLDMIDAIRNNHATDTFFKQVITNPSSFADFENDKGLDIFQQVEGKMLLCIPDIIIKNQQLQEILITHTHLLLAHLGAQKPADYMRDSMWWKHMLADIKEYCESCSICALTKTQTKKLMRTPESPYICPIQKWKKSAPNKAKFRLRGT